MLRSILFFNFLICFCCGCNNTNTKSKKARLIQIRIEEPVLVVDSNSIENVVSEIISGLKTDPGIINKYINQDSGCIVSVCNGALPYLQLLSSFDSLIKSTVVKPVVFTTNLSAQFFWTSWPKVNCDKNFNYDTKGIFIDNVNFKNIPVSLEISETRFKQKMLNVIKRKNAFAILLTPGLKLYLEKSGNSFYLRMIDFCFPCSA